MPSYTLLIKLRRAKTFLRLMADQEMVLRATLPPPAQFWTGKPIKALLESLAIWLDIQLHVVLDAADPADGFTLELTDETGIGLRTVFYDVRVLERPRRRPTARHELHAGGRP